METRASYGLYLVHTLTLHMYSDVSMKFAPSFNPTQSFRNSLLELLLTLAVATGIAYLSRTTVEEFFLRKKGAVAKNVIVDSAASTVGNLPEPGESLGVNVPPVEIKTAVVR